MTNSKPPYAQGMSTYENKNTSSTTGSSQIDQNDIPSTDT